MIAICTTTRDSLAASFTYDLVRLIQQYPDSFFTVSQGGLLINQRTFLISMCLGNSSISHVLLLDSDMRFPPDTIDRLLDHKKDIVGVNYLQRQANLTTAENKQGPIDSTDKTGLEEVDKIGLGVTLIDVDVFKILMQPWFATPWDGEKYTGEDVFFCKKAQDTGYNIYIDHDLSNEVKHIGGIEL